MFSKTQNHICTLLDFPTISSQKYAKLDKGLDFESKSDLDYFQ